MILAVAAACSNGDGNGDGGGDGGGTTTTDAPFLSYLPTQVPVVLRLPAVDDLRAREKEFESLARVLGWSEGSLDAFFFDIEAQKGIDPARPAGMAVAADGSWVRYLPAADKRLLSEAYRDRVAEGARYREEGDMVILSQGGEGPGTDEIGALMAGDIGVHIRFHPLLGVLSHPTDTLDLGVTVEAGGLSLKGRLQPGAESPTNQAIEAAVPARGGLIELLPVSMGLRVETTLPATIFDGLVARRIAVAAGIKEEADRIVLIRLLREALTAVDRESGIAFGVDFEKGKASFAVVGKIAAGPPSRVLNKMRKGGRHVFGSLVIDSEREDRMAKGILGFYAWVAQAELNVKGLPESLWDCARVLCDSSHGLGLAYTEHEGYFAFAAGEGADTLAQTIRRRLRGGPKRSRSAWMLHELRQASGREYVLGIIASGPGMAGAAAADRAALERIFGASSGSGAPRAVAVAVFREGKTLELDGRVAW